MTLHSPHLRRPGQAFPAPSQPAKHKLSSLWERDLSMQPPPQLGSGLRRRARISCLTPSEQIEERTLLVPAIPLFEECLGAFARGTVLPTPQGPMAIEDLLPGDQVETTMGPALVHWISSTAYVPDCEDPESLLRSLVRVPAGDSAFGGSSMDLLLGPAARMAMRHPRLTRLLEEDQVMVPVTDYLDGERLVEVTPFGGVDLFHIMLDRHALIPLGAISVESFHPGKRLESLSGIARRDSYMSLFPHLTEIGEFGPMTLTRATREVMDSLTNT